MTDLISIVVPVYNTSVYLPKCLDSLLNQTYPNIEIIVVNDGSTDNSAEVCNQYAKNHPNKIIVQHTVNRGLSAARNRGIDIAKGDYIGFVDSDDWCEPDMFQYLYDIIEEHHANMSSCGILEDFGDTKIITRESGHKSSNDCPGILREILVNPSVCGYAWNKLFKRSSIGTLRFDEQLMSCEDLDFCVKFALMNKTAVYGESKLYHYRQHNASMTGIMNYSPRKLSVIDVYERILPIYAQHAPHLLSIVRQNLLKIYINVLGRTINSNVNNEELTQRLRKGIRNYYDQVVNDKSVAISERLNIVLSKMFPGLMLSFKQCILKITRR